MNKPMTNWGRRARRAPGPDMLTADEEARLLRAWQQRGEAEARNRLVRAFHPMVASMARRFAPGGAEPDPDLVQQATIGLMKAADRFDPGLGNRFSTYAVWWARAEMQDYVRATGSVVRRPNSAQARKVAAQVGRLDAAMAADPGIDASEAETRVAAALGLGRDRLAELRAQVTGRDSSLNAPAGGEEGDERLALLVDPGSVEDPDRLHRLDVAVLRRVLVEALSALPDREREIILATQLSDPPATLEQLGARFGVSKERIRQLRERAFERLRAALSQSDAAPQSFV